MKKRATAFFAVFGVKFCVLHKPNPQILKSQFGGLSSVWGELVKCFFFLVNLMQPYALPNYMQPLFTSLVAFTTSSDPSQKIVKILKNCLTTCYVMCYTNP